MTNIHKLMLGSFRRFSQLSMFLVLIGSSACVAGEKPITVERDYRICPSDSTAEVVEAFRLEEKGSLTLAELQDRISETGFSVAHERYGVSRYSCAPGEISPDEEVLVVTAGFDSTNTYVRHFYVVVGEGEVVEQIELRKARLGP